MDLHKELIFLREKNVEFQQNALLSEVYSILKGNVSDNHLFGFNTTSLKSDVLVITDQKLNSEKIFSERDIKNCCVKFSLRFLNNKNYKSELPYDAHIKKTAFEIETGQTFNFMMLTEASNFTSPYPNTQHLLFADIGNGEYYFIHEWGREFTPYRKIASLPYRNIEFLFIYILLLSGILTLVTPTTFLTTKPNIDYFSMIRMAYFFWCVVFISAIFTYYVIGIRKGLNNTQWDSSSFI